VQDSKSADANKLDDTDREDCNSFYSSLESWNGVNILEQNFSGTSFRL